MCKILGFIIILCTYFMNLHCCIIISFWLFYYIFIFKTIHQIISMSFYYTH